MRRLLLFVLFLAIAFYVAWPAFTGYRIHASLDAQDPRALERSIDFESVRGSMRQPVLDQLNTRIDSVIGGLGPIANVIKDKIPTQRIEQIVDGALESAVTPERVVEVYSEGGDFSDAIKTAVLAEIDKQGGMAALFGIKGDSSDAEFPGSGENSGRSSGGGGNGLTGQLGKLFGNDNVRKVIGKVTGKVSFDSKDLAEKLFPGFSPPKAQQRSTPTGGKPDGFGFSNVKSFGFAGPLAMQLGVARDTAAKGPDVTAEMAFHNYDWRVTKLTPNLLEVKK